MRNKHSWLHSNHLNKLDRIQCHFVWWVKPGTECLIMTLRTALNKLLTCPQQIRNFSLLQKYFGHWTATLWVHLYISLCGTLGTLKFSIPLYRANWAQLSEPNCSSYTLDFSAYRHAREKYWNIAKRNFMELHCYGWFETACLRDTWNIRKAPTRGLFW